MNNDGHDATIVREVNAKSSNGAGQVPYTNKEPQGLLLEALKMAATYSPTMRSTIGVAELNDPVRNGKGWDLSAITT